MDKDKEKQEQISKLAKQIGDSIRQTLAKDKDPINETKIQRMVEEQIKLAQEKGELGGRTGGEFDVSKMTGEYLDEEDKKEFRGQQLQPKPAMAKMLMPKQQLKRYHNPDVASKILEFQDLNDDVYIVGKLMAQKTGLPFVEAVRSTKIYQNMQDRLKGDDELRKALYTSGSGAGSEWIPTGFSNQLIEAVRLQLKVAGMFPSISMPTNPYKMPVQGSRATGYLAAESTTDGASKITETTPGTSNFEFSAKKLACRILWSEELDEDSIVNTLNFTKQESATAIAEALEKAILDGDDSGTHQDSDVTSSTDARKAFKGLRYYALNNAGTTTLDFSNGAPTVSLLRNLRKLAGIYGVNPKDAFWTVSANGYIRMLTISEVLTGDKLPQDFTLKNGVLAAFDGSPIVVSEFVRNNLNASGVYDGTTTDRTVIHYTYAPGFWIGNRGAITLKTTEDIETDQIILVAKKRVAFEDPYGALTSGVSQALLGYNVAS